MNSDKKKYFEKLIAQYGSSVKRQCWGFEKDPSKAQDLYQKVCFSIFKSLDNFKGQCSEKTWIYRICHNVAVSHILKSKRNLDRELVSIEEIDNASEQENTTQSLREQEALQGLYNTIDKLKPADKQVFLLYLEDVEQSEISAIIELKILLLKLSSKRSFSMVNQDKAFDQIKLEWKEQKPEIKEIKMETMETLETEMYKLKRNVTIRNWSEACAAIIVAIIFIFKAIYSDTTLSMFFNILIAAGASLIIAYLWKKGTNLDPPDMTASTKDFLTYYKNQLVRQLKLLSNVKYWYVAPIGIGLIGLAVEKVYLNWSLGTSYSWNLAYFVVVVALLSGVIYLNEVVAVKDLKKTLKNLEEMGDN